MKKTEGQGHPREKRGADVAASWLEGWGEDPKMRTADWRFWKIATIGMAVVVTTVVVTTLVVGNWNEKEVTKPAPAVSKAKPRQVAASPSTRAPGQVRQAAGGPAVADIEACNTYAKSTTSDKTTEVVKDAVIGGAIGAGVGAAGGAIAGGGKGAGKGAAIGGIVGATAGTLYGLNETNKQDARAVEAYRSCMREHGYSS